MTALPAAPNVEIKKGTFEDVAAIAYILHESFAEFESLYTSAAFAATTPTAQQIRERWNEGPVWVAIQKGAIVGTVGAVPKDLGLYVRSMAVHPVSRGQGIAVQLLKEVEAFANHDHHKRLFLSTTPFLEDAIHLYERFGFQRSAEASQDLFGTPLFTMVKGLELASGESGAQIKEIKLNE
jgi:GNAT superfamily N-acetyltransferase